MDRKQILDKAVQMTNGSRQDDYGRPENSFQVIADLWNAYLDGIVYKNGGEVYVEPHDVAALLALLKIARIATGHGKSDNWVDLAGYAACGGELESETHIPQKKQVETVLSGEIEFGEEFISFLKEIISKCTNTTEETNG